MKNTKGPTTDYIKALRVRTVLMNEMEAVLSQCDLMAVPGNTSLPGTLESAEIAGTDVKPGSTATKFRGGTTFLGNMTGLPALVLPCGFSSRPPMLPIGLQLYGRAFETRPRSSELGMRTSEPRSGTSSDRRSDDRQPRTQPRIAACAAERDSRARPVDAGCRSLYASTCYAGALDRSPT